MQNSSDRRRAGLAETTSRPRDTERATSENLDLIRSGYDRFNGGEKVPPDDLWHVDSEYVNSADDPDPAVHRGLDAVRTQFKRWVDTYPDLNVEPVEFLAHADRVFVWTHFTGTAAVSGAPVEMEMAQVWTAEDGKIRRCEEYFDRAEALEVAGLPE
jgi:ketosteroid isomerase-like protein